MCTPIIFNSFFACCFSVVLLSYSIIPISTGLGMRTICDRAGQRDEIGIENNVAAAFLVDILEGIQGPSSFLPGFPGLG